MGKPRIPITDRRFKYTPAIQTDVRQTFERARRERLEEAKPEFLRAARARHTPQPPAATPAVRLVKSTRKC